MSNQTYYILYKRGALEGDGIYLGLNPQGEQELVPDHLLARRFDVLEEAEQTAAALREGMGDFNIEVRNTPV
ncbi:hypothetical protein BH11PSE11_BH11PSE11_22760 [soil metagenome]